METTFNNNTHGNLTQPLQSAPFIPMEDSKGAELATGHRWCKLIKKGDNSKLAASVAVEIPAHLGSIDEAAKYDSLRDAMQAALVSVQDAYIKSRAVAGATGIQYSELTLANLATFAVEYNASEGVGQLSEERIAKWFDAECRELYIVALAEHLGVTESATEQDVRKLEQLANSIRGNMVKLASRKPVMFDERVKKALNRALEITDTGDNMTARLRDKLNMAVNADDFEAVLGL